MGNKFQMLCFPKHFRRIKIMKPQYFGHYSNNCFSFEFNKSSKAKKKANKSQPFFVMRSRKERERKKKLIVQFWWGYNNVIYASDGNSFKVSERNMESSFPKSTRGRKLKMN